MNTPISNCTHIGTLSQAELPALRALVENGLVMPDGEQYRMPHPLAEFLGAAINALDEGSTVYALAEEEKISAD